MGANPQELLDRMFEQATFIAFDEGGSGMSATVFVRTAADGSLVIERIQLGDGIPRQIDLPASEYADITDTAPPRRQR